MSRKIPLLLALAISLAALPALAQSSLDSTNPALALRNRPLDLGAGALTANGGGTLGGVFSGDATINLGTGAITAGSANIHGVANVNAGTITTGNGLYTSVNLTGTAYESGADVAMTANGAGVNGPATAQTGMSVYATKNGWDTGTTVVGEVDGINVTTRQGGPGSDSSGILVNVQNTGTGFLSDTEMVASILDTSTGTLIYGVDIQEGSLNEPGAAYYGAVYSATYGTLTSAINIQSNTGASWTDFLVASQNGAQKVVLDGSGDLYLKGIVNAQSSGFQSQGAVSITSSGSFLTWNQGGGDGATWLINQQGGGGGGFYFDESTTSGVLTQRMKIDGLGNVVFGTGSALAASATAGFVSLPFVTAAPTGTPATVSGNSCVVNTTTFNIDCYIGTSWYHMTLTAGAL